MTTWFPHQHRTANDGITFEGEATGGGGGSGGVQTVTVPVSSAQILDLFNTPVVLIPGTPGFVTVVDSCAVTYLAGATPYTDNGGAIVISNPGIMNWFARNSAGIWDFVGNRTCVSVYNGGPVASDATDFDGKNVVLSQDTANPTAGDGTLLVTVSYFLAPTV